MGLCSSMDADEQAMFQNSKKYEAKMRANAKVRAQITNVLLLGTGQSGKSTVFKQMQVLHTTGFSKREKDNFRFVLRQNALDCMQVLINGANQFGYEWEDEENKSHADELLELDPFSTEFWQPHVAEQIDTLWNEEEAIKSAFANKGQLRLLDSCKYLLDNVSRYAEDEFEPSSHDIIRARSRTCGIVERVFTVDSQKYKFMDVGGQRSERRKWMNCFNEVAAILFIVAVSEFDQVLFEDETVNRMKESMSVFKTIVNNPQFKKTAIILFFNKHDIFKEKLDDEKDPERAARAHADIKKVFPNYDGKTREDAEAHINKEYAKIEEEALDNLFKNEEKPERFSTRFTQATDTNTMSAVMDKVKDVIIQHNLSMLRGDSGV